MKMEITENAIKYMEKKKSKALVIDMVINQIKVGWGGGSTRRYYSPILRIQYNNVEEKQGYDVYNVRGVRVFFPCNIKLDKNIVIDTKKIFFIEKLVLKDLDIIWVI